jgi:hypothetical protein
MTEQPGCAVGVGDNNTIVICVQDGQSCISTTLSKAQAEMTAKLLLLCIDALEKA